MTGPLSRGTSVCSEEARAAGGLRWVVYNSEQGVVEIEEEEAVDVQSCR